MEKQSELQNDVELTQENTYDQPPHPSMIYSINDLKKIEKKLSEGVKQSVINLLNAINRDCNS